MKSVSICWLFSGLLFPLATFSTNLVIENIRPVIRPGVAASQASVIFDLRWENAWHTSKNHDAVWIFMKPSGGYGHIRLASEGHQLLQNRIESCPEVRIEVAEGGVGLYIYLDQVYRGDVDVKLQLMVATEDQRINNRMFKGNFSVYGLEMVYIPEGPFSLGTPDTSGIKKAAFYRSDAKGEPKGLVKIQSESEIKVAAENNALYYWSENALYNGDQKGPVPASFPKGFKAFYLMKYEINQGQYAAFLNALPSTWTYSRSPLGGDSYSQNRGSIYLEEGEYVADSPHRPMNYISFTDGLAFADWAGLRPITELE